MRSIRWTACVPILLIGCGGPDPVLDDPARAAAEVEGSAGASTAAGSVTADVERTGRLQLEGEVLAAPGEYELLTSCSYDRTRGALSFGMHPAVGAEVERGPATFGVAAGRKPGTRAPLEDGTFAGEFSYNEVAGDGTVPTFRGDATVTLRVVDRSRERFPILEIEASGEGEGVRFEAAGRCQAMVMG